MIKVHNLASLKNITQFGHLKDKNNNKRRIKHEQNALDHCKTTQVNTLQQNY